MIIDFEISESYAAAAVVVWLLGFQGNDWVIVQSIVVVMVVVNAPKTLRVAVFVVAVAVAVRVVGVVVAVVVEEAATAVVQVFVEFEAVQVVVAAVLSRQMVFAQVEIQLDAEVR